LYLCRRVLSDPTPDEHYFKLRGGTATHPEGHWGTEDTIIKLKDIAEKYYKLSGRIISINDISLPRGGLFDYRNTWKPPHKSHRTGTDADINQGQGPKNVDQIPCYKNDKLKEAIKKVAGGKSYPILRCEDGNLEYCIPPEGKECIYYHIDFD
jgi:murein endopeptidase